MIFCFTRVSYYRYLINLMLNNYAKAQVTKQYMLNSINASHPKQGADRVESNKQITTILQEQTEKINITNEMNYYRYMKKMQNTNEDSSLHKTFSFLFIPLTLSWREGYFTIISQGDMMS